MAKTAYKRFVREFMHTWKDEITTALCKNGEYWEDVEYTEMQLGMSPDDSDGDLHFCGHEVAAYTEGWVYYVDFDMDWGYATVHSLPRHPRVFIEQEEVRHNIIGKALAAKQNKGK